MTTKKQIYQKTLDELKPGDVIAYAKADFCGAGLQSINDTFWGSVEEINKNEEGDDYHEGDAVVEIRVVARRNPTPFVPLPAKLVTKKKKVKK